jgi:hypothetical protein
MGCFYYARCLHEGHGVKKNEDEAKKYYSKVSVLHEGQGVKKKTRAKPRNITLRLVVSTRGRE